MIAHATIHYKKMRLDSLEDQKLVKKQHEQGLRKENVCKKVATSIKNEKTKKSKCQKDGEKYLNPQEMVESMNKKVIVVTEDIQKLKASKKLDAQKFRDDCKELEAQIATTKHENQVLNIKLKEKD